MDFDLVCEIQIETAESRKFFGTGYPIAPNRIITANHVVADAKSDESHASEGDARAITLTFVAKGITVSGPVYIEWSGAKAGVDVAVLRCELPAAVQPAHKLQTEPPGTEVEWLAQGYTDYGKERRQDGKDDWRGRVTAFTDHNSSVALECSSGPSDPEKWNGGSGSLAFDLRTRAAVAVITKHEREGKTRDHLIAVPLCYLLNSPATKEGFRAAIEFESYKKRENHCQLVMKEIASQLEEFSEDRLVMIAKEIAQLSGAEASAIDLKSKQEILAEHTAACIVGHAAVTDVVSYLTGLVQDHSQKESDIVANIISHLLPLNYAPDAIRHLSERIAKDQFGFLEDAVSTRTLAEIIMAGYDRQPAKFASFTIDGDLRGHTALDYEEGPEEGPGDPHSALIGVLRAARNLLRDLLALTSTPSWSSGQLQQPRASGYEEGELRRDIDACASPLRGALTGLNKLKKRTSYCVLRLPEDPQARDFRKQVLHEVSRHVPQLVFVELTPPNPAREREFEVLQYVKHLQVRVIPAQQGRQS